MEGLTEEEAFNQAALTVEVYDDDAIAEVPGLLRRQLGPHRGRHRRRAGRHRYESAPGEWGFRAYVVPLEGGLTLVIAAWGDVNDALQARADRVATSLVFGG